MSKTRHKHGITLVCRVLTSKGAGLTFDLPSGCFPLGENAYEVAPLTEKHVHIRDRNNEIGLTQPMKSLLSSTLMNHMSPT